MLHLLAYTKASAGGQTNEALTAQNDGYATISSNGNFILPKSWWLPTLTLSVRH
jgi:hypothetical protein